MREQPSRRSPWDGADSKAAEVTATAMVEELKGCEWHRIRRLDRWSRPRQDDAWLGRGLRTFGAVACGKPSASGRELRLVWERRNWKIEKLRERTSPNARRSQAVFLLWHSVSFWFLMDRAYEAPTGTIEMWFHKGPFPT